MILERIEFARLVTPLKTPFKTALRTVEFALDLLVKITTDTGLIGYGTATPTPAITGDTYESILTAYKKIKARLEGKLFTSVEHLTSEIARSIPKCSSAQCAFEIAAYDLFSQQQKQPLYIFLGGDTKTQLETNVTISLNNAETMLKDSLIAKENGFRIFKIKLGHMPEEDLTTVKLIAKHVGPEIVLRLDINQAYTKEDSLLFINALSDLNLNIALIEQPVKAHLREELAFISNHSKIPILADESLFNYEDIHKLNQYPNSCLWNIKLAKCGGISEAKKIMQYAKESNVECFMGCMLESSIAVAAAAHFAAAHKNILHFDLDPPFLFAKDPVKQSFRLDGPSIVLNANTPGLGIKTIDYSEPIE